MEDKTEIAVIKTEMKNIIKKVDEGFKLNSEEHKEIIAIFQKAIDKKAGKWVEKIIIGAGSVIGTAILIALLSQIIN